MQKQVKPIVNNYWLKDEFPFQIIPELAKLNICGLTYKGYGCPGKSSCWKDFSRWKWRVSIVRFQHSSVYRAA